MNFNNYLIESTILYESIIQYNTILEAVAEIAEIPPSWVVEFTKFENDKGEFSKTIVKETVAIANKVAYEHVIKDTFNDQVQGLVVMNKDIPLFALIKNPKNTSKVTLMAIDPTPAKKLHRPGWTTYTAHDAKYYAAHGKYSEKTVTTTEAPKALEELLTIFVSNFVKGSNDDMDINDALHEIPISIKTVIVETDNQRAQSSASGSNQNSGSQSSHANKAIKKFSDDYLRKFVTDYHKLVDKEVPNIDKAEELIQKSIDGTLQQININKVTEELKEYNKLIRKFSHEYKTKKATNPTAPNWEEEFVKDFIDSLTVTT